MGVDASTEVGLLLSHVDYLTKKLTYINQSAEALAAGKPFPETIRDILRSVREYYDADSAYLFEVDHHAKTITNTLEDYAPGIDTVQRHIDSLPYSLLDFWETECGASGYICVRDVTKYRTQQPELAEPYLRLLEQQGVHSLIYAPISENERIIGFIGVDNPRQYTYGMDFITTIGHYTSLLLHRRAQEATLNIRYREAENFLDSVSGSYLFTARANITQNYIENIRGVDVIVNVADGMPYTEDVDAFCAHLDTHSKKNYRSVFGRDALLAAFAAGRETVSTEVYYQSHTGSFIWARNSGHLRQQPETGDVIVFMYQTDITNEKIQETVLRNMVVREYDFIMCVHCMENTATLVSCNPTREDCRTLGDSTDYDATVRRYADAYLHEEDRADFIRFMSPENVWRELEHAEVCTRSFCVYLHGQPRYKKYDFYCLNREYRLLAYTRADFTDTYTLEKQQEQKLREALKAAQQADRAKSEFVSRISHDIRTPIGIISNMTDFAYEDIRDPDKLKNDLEKIQTSNRFLLSLVNDVLDISKIDSGKIALSPEPYPYDDYIANIRNMLEPLCRQKGLVYRITAADDSVTIVADKIRLNQITFNLLSNAVKYTPQGGLVSFSSRSVPTADGFADCELTISDTGIGMSKEFQQVMFEPFSQEYDNPLRLRSETGTGLGLSIVKKLVDQMGGTIRVKSRIGKGSTFILHFHFPAAAPVPETQSAAAQAPCFVPLHGRVLLAEDNDINAEIVTRMLTSFGLSVERAENGSYAISIFKASKTGSFCAILMDIQMPLVNGYDATHAIRALERPDAAVIPIIAMTADAFKDASDRAQASGMNDFITKPIDSSVLYRVLAGILRP